LLEKIFEKKFNVKLKISNINLKHLGLFIKILFKENNKKV